MKVPSNALIGAVPPTILGWFFLFGPGAIRQLEKLDIATLVAVIANAPALAVSGVISGNIHAPNAFVFAVISFAQWTGMAWVIIAIWRRLCARRPNQAPQHNAGSRPSSGDSSVSETPSSLGPRG